MADHVPVFLLYYDSVWNDVTADVSQNDTVKLAHGGGEVSDAPKPSSVQLTLEDPDGTYRPYRATSPLYGKAGRNTPLLVGYDLVSEDFEDASLNITIGAGSSVNAWARSSTSPHTGSWCLKSGATANSAFSDAIIEAPAGATVCLLWYRTDSQSTDVLRISTGGILRVQTGGTGGSWTQIAVPIVPNTVGARQVYVRYLKDSSGTGGADAVYIDDVRFLTGGGMFEVSSWTPDATLGFDAGPPARGRQWTDITAEGLLRRIGTWTDLLQSAMHRAISSLSTLTGFWPGEDDRNATQMSSATGGTPATVSDVTFGAEESPGGGSTSITLGSAGQIQGVFETASDTTGGQVAWSFKLAAVPGSATDQALFTSYWSNGYTWKVSVDNLTYTLDVTDADGTSLLATATAFTIGDPDEWTTMRLQVSYSGGTVSWGLGWYVEADGNPVLAVPTGSFAGTAGYPQRFKVAAGTFLTGASFAYIYGTSGITSDLLSTTITKSFAGYPGETAGARWARLLSEQGLPGELIGLAADTELMGPQRPDTLLALLQEIRDTDGGMITDSAGQIGVALRTRKDLYYQDPALELTYGVNVGPPLTPVLDDLGTHNHVTVSQRDGGSATAVDTTSTMSISAPPDGVGLNKQTIDVNVSDEARLADLAGWWLNLGTIPDVRYSSVTVDLDANPELEDSVNAVRPGDRITIDGLDPDRIDLMVIGDTDTHKTQKRRQATFTCVPYRPYDVAVYDDTDRRYDSRTSTLNAGYSSSATTMVVTFADAGDLWSTASVPYDWSVAGERITVTAMGAVSGSGPYTQSATVTRAVNGVSKAQVAGEAVHIHPDQQARYAL